MKAVLPMAGPGTRLHPFTHTQPKHLIKIAGKPLIEYVFKTLLETGIRDIILIVGYKKDQIINHLGEKTKFGVRIEHVTQNQPKGIADAVILAEQIIGDAPFLVYLPDTLIPGGIKKYAKIFLESDAYAMVLTSKLSGSKLYSAGTVQTDENGRVIKLEEKSPSPRSNLALAGVYFFKSSAIFDIIKKLKPSKRGELEITDAIQKLVEDGYDVRNNTISKEYIDAGDPEGLLKANRYILSFIENDNKGEIERGVALKGEVKIREGTVVYKNSKLYGPVFIGRKCKIGPSTRIGPYVSIDDNVIIKGGSIKNTIVMNGSQLYLKSSLYGSLIGRNVKVTEETQSEEGRRLILGDHSSVLI